MIAFLSELVMAYRMQPGNSKKTLPARKGVILSRRRRIFPEVMLLRSKILRANALRMTQEYVIRSLISYLD